MSALLVGAALVSVPAMAFANSDEAAKAVLMGTQAAQGNVDSRTIVVKAPKGKVDTAVFGKRPFMRSPRLSPDGT